MPFIQLKTNLEKEKLTKEKQQKFFNTAAELYQACDTSTDRLTVSFEGDLMMCQGGSFEPCFEVLAVDSTSKAAQDKVGIVTVLKHFIQQEFDVPSDRIVLRFCNVISLIEMHKDNITM